MRDNPAHRATMVILIFVGNGEFSFGQASTSGDSGNLSPKISCVSRKHNHSTTSYLTSRVGIIGSSLRLFRDVNEVVEGYLTLRHMRLYIFGQFLRRKNLANSRAGKDGLVPVPYLLISIWRLLLSLITGAPPTRSKERFL